MPWPTLDAVPDYNSALKFTPALDEISFGDGYTQVSERGLNSTLQTKTVTFTKAPAQAKAIYDQLRAWRGVVVFGFTHPVEGVRKGVRTVGEVTLNPDAYGKYTVTATFKEVAEVEV